MRLISCHIENFGKLEDVTLSFEAASGIKTLCENNGWGKSTLAAFIKVMFFGFDNEGRRSSVENERQRFKPWQGGVYGGQLTFEADGKRYIISRTFGTKEKDDEFALQDADTKLVSNNFSKNIGEELFRIDSASFARSIYISQNDCVTKATDSINAKLGNLTDNTDDLNNYETAAKRLADKLNAMSKTRKTGELYKQKEKIAGLKQEIKKGEAIDASMDELLGLKNGLHTSYEALKEEQKQLQARQKAISEYKDILVKKKEYEHLCADAARKKSLYEDKRALFPGRLPEGEEIDKYITLEYQTSVLKKNLDFNRLDDEEAKELSLLENRFSMGIPENEAIEEAKGKVSDMQALGWKIEKNMLTEEEAGSLERFGELFAEGVPAEAEIDSLSKAWSFRSEKKNALSSKKAAVDMLKMVDEANRQSAQKPQEMQDTDNWSGQGTKRSKRKMQLLPAAVLFAVAMAALSAVIALGGQALGVMTPLVGAGILAVDLIAVVIFAVVMAARGRARNSREADASEGYGASGMAGASEGYGASGMAGASEGYGTSGVAGASERYENSEAARGAEERLDVPYMRLQREIEADEELIFKTETDMKQFFAKYDMPYEEGSVISELYKLKENIKLYGRLLEKSQNGDVCRLKEDYKRLHDEVEGFLKRYGVGMDGREQESEAAERDTAVDEADNAWSAGAEISTNAERNADRAALEYYVNLIYKLETSVNTYIALKNKKESFEKAYGEYEKNLEVLKEFIREINLKEDGVKGSEIKEINIEEANVKGSEIKESNVDESKRGGDIDFHLQVQNIKDIRRSCLDAEAEYERAAGAKKEYETKNSEVLDVIKKEEAVEEDVSLAETEERLSEISAEIEKYHTSMAAYERQLDELQEKRDEITDSENRLEDLQEHYEVNEKKLKVLQKTQKYLEQAKISLTAKYTQPIKEGFDKYFGLLCGIESENYQLDANLDMSVLEQGMPRNTAFLSAGYQDMVGICMRMALIDAMYKEEKPFVIFDDPFVNLDGDRTKGALRLLDMIAKEYQVVYFTCNEGRRQEGLILY